MEVVSVNVSEEKGTVKHSVSEVRIDEQGIVGDGHAGAWHRQVSMLSEEIIKEFAGEVGREIKPGEFAENITTRGLDLRNVAVLDRVIVNEVELEVTQIGKGCHGDACAIFREVGKCVMPREGVFCRVLHGGNIRPGAGIRHIARPFCIRVITMSDRASRGEYEDRSGPKVKELLEEFFAGKRWHHRIEMKLLPDDTECLRKELEAAREEEVGALFTTGGTGVGPHDITPDVVAHLIDKEVPGIMEHIRVKFGARKPNALLSRGIAGIMGQTLVYTLPGSAKAVEEYMGEILKTFEHLVFMIHGIDTH